MTARSAQETLESLRVTLQKLEQTADPATDGRDVVELKQILLNRIAELEALQVMQPPENVAASPSPAELPPIAVPAEIKPANQADDQSALEKLD